VVYDLVPIVEGRNLRCEVRWPPPTGDEGNRKKRKRPSQRTIKVMGSGQFSIASAFKPVLDSCKSFNKAFPYPHIT